MAFDLAVKFRKSSYLCFQRHKIPIGKFNLLQKIDKSQISMCLFIISIVTKNINNIRIIISSIRKYIFVIDKWHQKTIFAMKRDNISPHKNTAFKTAPKILPLTIIGNKYMYLVGICIMLKDLLHLQYGEDSLFIHQKT